MLNTYVTDGAVLYSKAHDARQLTQDAGLDKKIQFLIERFPDFCYIYYLFSRAKVYFMKKKVALKRIFHRDRWRIAIMFDYDAKLKEIVRSISGSAFSGLSEPDGIGYQDLLHNFRQGEGKSGVF
jgi:hypothetical protein